MRGDPRAYTKRLPRYQTYWLVDVDARRLEVRTKPHKDGTYAKVDVLDEDATVVAPGTKVTLEVSALLP